MNAVWRSQAVYRFAVWCLSPLVFAHLLWRTLHDGGYLYWRQRRGLSLPQAGEVIWIHAASVGEVNTAAPLIKAINQHYPQLKLLLTTNTPTGKAAIADQKLEFLHSAYLPLDYSFAVKRFIRANQIRCGIIVETEIWPVLLEYSSFPLAIVNGRLSQRTLRVTQGGLLNKLLNRIFQRAVQHIDLVLARSDSDAAGFALLGIPGERIQTLGNLKFAASLPSGNSVGGAQSARPFKRPFCLLASTHHDEELQLATLWMQQQRSEVLLIAPRHPDRSAVLIRQLKALSASLSVRSNGDSVDDNTQIYLADTLGEMACWFEHAAAVFIGGSLIPHGGHNMLEPAQFGQSVVIGPHVDNFRAEMQLFLAADAIVQIEQASDAISAMIGQLDAPAAARQRGQRALQLLAANQQIVHHYVDALSPLLSADR